MRETALNIGRETQLLGILTEPDAADLKPHSPVILLLNSGLLGRIGPFRLHVTLARRFAEMGFRTLRLDLSGIGDSGRHRDARNRSSQHLGDITTCVEYLQANYDVSRFLVMGICTGADYAHKAIVDDERIVGAVCIDGYAYPTARYLISLYWGKLFRPSSWKTLLRLTLEKLKLRSARNKTDSNNDLLKYHWKLPPKAQTEADFQKIITKDARMLCIFTAGWPYSYERQLADAFPAVDFGKNISLAFLENATHTFKIYEDRRNLIRTVVAWLESDDIDSRLTAQAPWP
ncbi:MAG: alpha/beta hydrolase [Gammaproteobacteria bacterium]|nr:alpha/beta hydrolase [Gammaproteobacteria bacterium]